MIKAQSISMRFINMWVTLFLIWMIANNTLAMPTLITGAIISAFISLAFSTFSSTYSVIHWTPKVLVYYLLYFTVFVWELLKANLAVMKVVFKPRLDIHPGIVEIKTTLQSPLGRLALANSITLTPGTLVVDIREDSLFVHWIDVKTRNPQQATEQIAARFEHYLKVIYG